MLELLTVVPQSQIGEIGILATLEEAYTDAIQTTEHPVQIGASITDHAFKLPSEVTMRCGWTNSTEGQAAIISTFGGGGMSTADYVASVYSQLLALQESREVFTLITSRRYYDSMLIASLGVTTDKTTSQALIVTATFRRIIIVGTQATILPPRQNQANQASTAEMAQRGNVAPVVATPNEGGAVPASDF